MLCISKLYGTVCELAAESSGRQSLLCHQTSAECKLTCVSHRPNNAKGATQAAGVQY